jgi:MFS family permease/quinol monooxygenase YgiN
MTSTAVLPLWQPLRQPLFRSLWIASTISSIGTWMHDVGAAWLMTSISPSPFLVALMQAASSLPFFLLALPAGAIADVIDRRQMLLWTQSWMLAIAAGLGALTVSNLITPWMLIGLTFALSIGSAMNLPVWQAVVPELVAKEELPSAVSLNGIVINLSRLIGPALAGLLIAATGTGAVFLINAASFLGVIVILSTWQRSAPRQVLPAERFWGAIQAGVRYVRFAPTFQAVLLRTAAYILFASALFALLPILGRRDLGLDALGYGLLMGSWGMGGLVGAFLLPKLRQRFSIDHLVAGASVCLGSAMFAIAQLHNFYGVCAAMILVGMASLSVMVSLSVSAQTAVPTWVRARALSIYLLVFQGCMAVGSLLWGAIAQQTSTATALMAAAAGLMAGAVPLLQYRLRCVEKLDLTASLHWSQPTHVFEPCPNDGPVLVTLEYRIDVANAEDFTSAMQAISRIRRRDGAIQWGLFQDLSDPGRFVETILVESWAEHERQFERTTNSDRTFEERAWAFHVGHEPPKISQMIYTEPD